MCGLDRRLCSRRICAIASDNLIAAYVANLIAGTPVIVACVAKRVAAVTAIVAT